MQQPGLLEDGQGRSAVVVESRGADRLSLEVERVCALAVAAMGGGSSADDPLVTVEAP